MKIGESDPIFSDIPRHIVKGFFKFHRENPHVLKLIFKFAREIRNAGFRKYSMVAITERIRWHVHVETNDANFKFCNNHRSCYARIVMKLDPSFEGFFQLRSNGGKVPLDYES